MIARGVHVMLQVGGRTGSSGGSNVESFVVTSMLTKGYNQWYMCERGKQILRKGMDKGNFRFQARIIRYDHGIGLYEYADLVDSEWEVKHIFVLADGSDIKEEKGKVKFSLM